MIQRAKAFAKVRMPFLNPVWSYIHLLRLRVQSSEEIFTNIYHKRQWGDVDSLSGPGSTLPSTVAIRQALPSLLAELGCRSLLDIPCGDFFWMRAVEMDVEYVGADIVAELVEANQRQYGSDRRRFLVLDMTRDSLPRADLILCRDGLVHLSNADVFRALRGIRASSARYLLTTTFVRRSRTRDIPTGAWRPISLQSPPFCFPPPLRLLDEACPLEGYQDKRLGLWRVSDIP